MLIYGLLTVVALCMSAWAPRDERIAAYWAGMVILTGWGLWSLSVYTHHGPAFWLAAVGVYVNPVEIWAVTDFVSAAVILMIARVRWWSVALWGFLCAQVILHCCYLHAGMTYLNYEWVLDTLYLAQIAVLFAIGGKGCVDCLLDWYDNARNVSNQAGAAQTQKADRA